MINRFKHNKYSKLMLSSLIILPLVVVAATQKGSSDTESVYIDSRKAREVNFSDLVCVADVSYTYPGLVEQPKCANTKDILNAVIVDVDIVFNKSILSNNEYINVMLYGSFNGCAKALHTSYYMDINNPISDSKENFVYTLSTSDVKDNRSALTFYVDYEGYDFYNLVVKDYLGNCIETVTIPNS